MISTQNKTIAKENKELGVNSFLKEKISQKAWYFLIRPWITEKSHFLMSNNEYVFKVSKKANKNQIAKAIEDLYKVKVKKVRIINIPSKKRIYGRKIGKKVGYKKAIIKLKKGDKIELFKGV